MAKFCSNCGASLKEGAVFCTDCGASQNTGDVAQGSGYRDQGAGDGVNEFGIQNSEFGIENDAGALQYPPPQYTQYAPPPPQQPQYTQYAPPTPQQPQYTQYAPPTPQYMQQPQYPQYYAPPATQKKKSNAPVIIAIAVVIVVALVVVGAITKGFGLFNSSGKNSGVLGNLISSAVTAGSNTWPDNEFTRVLPKPGISFSVIVSSKDEFVLVFTGAALDDIKAYAEQLKAAGFTIDADTTEMEVLSITVYTYKARNAGGYEVELTSSYGSGGLNVSK